VSAAWHLSRSPSQTGKGPRHAWRVEALQGVKSKLVCRGGVVFQTDKFWRQVTKGWCGMVISICSHCQALRPARLTAQAARRPWSTEKAGALQDVDMMRPSKLGQIWTAEVVCRITACLHKSEFRCRKRRAEAQDVRPDFRFDQNFLCSRAESNAGVVLDCGNHPKYYRSPACFMRRGTTPEYPQKWKSQQESS
jgi:hypothetical protein